MPLCSNKRADVQGCRVVGVASTEHAPHLSPAFLYMCVVFFIPCCPSSGVQMQDAQVKALPRPRSSCSILAAPTLSPAAIPHPFSPCLVFAIFLLSPLALSSVGSCPSVNIYHRQGQCHPILVATKLGGKLDRIQNHLEGKFLDRSLRDILDYVN